MFEHPGGGNDQWDREKADQGQSWARVKHHTYYYDDAEQIRDNRDDPFGENRFDRFDIIDTSRRQVADRCFIKVGQPKTCDLIEDTDPEIFDYAMSQQVGEIDKGVLQDPCGDEDDRKEDAHPGQTFRFGDDDVLVYDHIDQVGLQRIERGQDDGQQGAEQEEFAVWGCKPQQADQ